jgi:hypothetical protein
MNSIPVYAKWHIQLVHNETGEVLQESESPNLVVRIGREYVLRNLFNLSGAFFLYGAAGPCSTPPDIEDTQLEYEYIATTGYSARKGLTNTSEAALTAGDITSDDVTIDDCDYYKKLTVQYSYNGAVETGLQYQPFRAYMLNSFSTLPATPTSASGVMLNHFVDDVTYELGPTTTLKIRITLRV